MKTKVVRGTTVTALVVAATSLTAPQTMAAAASMDAGVASGAVGTRTSPGKLGALTDLVVGRLRVSDDVAASKFGTDSPIDDPAACPAHLALATGSAVAVERLDALHRHALGVAVRSVCTASAR
ncbi:hypothetical protein [Nonomuraea sp. KM88]|uniref:hypothetical protein n=1 Tax=Nonomuraea sp. KM88 TaxID=3457427 RepID=UPI003FCE8A65